MELLVIVGEDLRLYLLRSEFIEFFLDSFRSGVGVVTTDVDTSAGLRYLTAHLFVEAADNDVSFAVLAVVIRTRQRNRTAFGFTDTDDEHLDAFFFGALGYCDRIVLVVLTIGDKDDSPAGVRLLAEATDRGAERRSDGRSLRLDEFGFDGIEEHLGGHVVAGDRQLHEGIAGKNDQSHFVIDHVIHQFAEHLFGAVQTVRRYVFRQHGVGDIQRHDGFDTLPFLRMLGLAELRTGSGDDEESERQHHDAELHSRTHAAGIRHKGLHEFRVTELLYLTTFAFGLVHKSEDEDRHECQKI